MPLTAQRLDRISPSQTIAISTKARALKAATLCGNEPGPSPSCKDQDFKLRSEIAAAAITPLSSGFCSTIRATT